MSLVASYYAPDCRKRGNNFIIVTSYHYYHYFERKKERKVQHSREMLLSEAVSLLVIEKGRFRWLGLMGHKNCADWIRYWTTVEMDGVEQRGRLGKIWRNDSKFSTGRHSSRVKLGLRSYPHGLIDSRGVARKFSRIHQPVLLACCNCCCCLAMSKGRGGDKGTLSQQGLR